MQYAGHCTNLPFTKLLDKNKSHTVLLKIGDKLLLKYVTKHEESLTLDNVIFIVRYNAKIARAEIKLIFLVFSHPLTHVHCCAEFYI